MKNSLLSNARTNKAKLNGEYCHYTVRNECRVNFEELNTPSPCAMKTI